MRTRGGPPSWEDTAGAPSSQSPFSTQAALPRGRRSLWPPTFPTVGFSLRAPHSGPALTCLPSPPSGWPGLHSAHTLPGLGVRDPRDTPSLPPVWPLLCSLPNLLLMALCPLTPPVPAHSVFTEVPLPPPAWSVSPRSLPAPSPSRTGALGRRGAQPSLAAASATASELPHGSWAAASPHSPACLPGQTRVTSPSAAACGQGPYCPAGPQAPQGSRPEPSPTGVSPPPPTCAESCSKPQEMPPGAASHPAISDTQEPRGALLGFRGDGRQPRGAWHAGRSPAAPTSTGLQVRAGLASASALWAPALTACPGLGRSVPIPTPAGSPRLLAQDSLLNARPPAPTTAPPPGTQPCQGGATPPRAGPWVGLRRSATHAVVLDLASPSALGPARQAVATFPALWPPLRASWARLPQGEPGMRMTGASRWRVR